MKRFVTYLYECERGYQNKNVGFCRVDIRDKKVKLQVSVRGYGHSLEKGTIYGLMGTDQLIGIPLSEIKIVNGQGDAEWEEFADAIGGSEFGFHQISGIGISMKSQGYLASVWKDEAREPITQGGFQLFQRIGVVEEEKRDDESCDAKTVVQMQELEEASIEAIHKQNEMSDEGGTYRKIQLDEIRELPSPNWHLANNSFLVHGLWNYGYLVLKTVVEENETKLYLGVPGVFEKPEMVMAVVFGFSEFEAIPSQMIEESMETENRFSNIEKNQEPKSGDFGCWFVELHK